MQANSHNQAIPETVIAAVEAAIDAQLQALATYATPLTADDRRNLLKTGPKTFQFVELAHTLAQENPQLTSKAFDMAAFSADWNDTHNLLGVENKARQLLELIEDIRMTAGSDSAHHALEVYADFKSAADRNVAEAHAAYEQLKAAYPAKNQKRRKNEVGQT
ncbi:MAG: hypothetical protein LBF83_00130 [Spirochaetaceae bacterium]|jgi:hypothetical protein|nr:hypothetical protein [Spirochaetaceae bacterium]